jgi:hypothetical protein
MFLLPNGRSKAIFVIASFKSVSMHTIKIGYCFLKNIVRLKNVICIYRQSFLKKTLPSQPLHFADH